MPIYEYRCQRCQQTFEYMQSFSDRPKTRCAECGGKLEKLISAAAFHLKGSGWYKTDYGSSSGGGGGGAKAGASQRKGEESAKKATEGGAGGKKGKE